MTIADRSHRDLAQIIASLAFVLGLLLGTCVPSPAYAEEVTLGWTPASGPVATYGVISTRGQGYPWVNTGETADATPRWSITLPGGVYRFRVYGVDANGRPGPFSVASDPIEVSGGGLPVSEAIGEPGQPVQVVPGVTFPTPQATP